MALVVIAAFAAFMPAAASADMTTTASTVYGATPTTSPLQGIYDDYTIKQTFEYGNGVEPQAGTEDLKRWVVDSPAGLAGNPNQVPYADRCDPSAFDPVPGVNSPYFDSNCPASSIVGVATIYLATDALSGAIPAGTPLTPLNGIIYILKTDPEVPTTLATRITSTIYQAAVCSSLPGAPAAPCDVHPKTQSVLAPVTEGADGDFRLRTIPKEDSAPPVAYGPTGLGFAAGPTPAHIYRIDQHLYGQTNAALPFVRFPTRCAEWKSYSYVTGTGANSNADSNPDPLGHPNEYKMSAADIVNPDCSAPPALGATATGSVSTHTRDSNPQVSVTVSNPTAETGDMPKTMTTTLPASITTDLQSPALAAGNLCEIAQEAAGSCPAASKVGTASIKTPFIVAGLTGDVYAVRNAVPGRAIPDLLIDVAGTSNAINFKLHGSSTFVGAKGNQIQTTFDNLPQSPFTEFNVTIAGGQDSLLTISKCPADGGDPGDGPINYSINGWAGGATASSTATKFSGCFGVGKLPKQKKCVKYTLKVKPSYASKADLQKAELWIKNGRKYKRVKVYKKVPTTLSYRFGNRIKHGKTYRYKVRAVYKASDVNPTAEVFSQFSKFKRCK